MQLIPMTTMLKEWSDFEAGWSAAWKWPKVANQTIGCIVWVDYLFILRCWCCCCHSRKLRNTGQVWHCTMCTLQRVKIWRSCFNLCFTSECKHHLTAPWCVINLTKFSPFLVELTMRLTTSQCISTLSANMLVIHVVYHDCFPTFMYFSR